tara:strand:+ start:63 stop:236 length:174 start_codon:yes stop_codon:yes gene_type:complete
MAKSMEQVLLENFSDFDPVLYALVQDNGEGIYFRRDLWPAEWGDAPTDEQISAWMSE